MSAQQSSAGPTPLGQLPNHFDRQRFQFWEAQFSAADRQRMIEEDRQTWRIVGAILLTIVSIGCAMVTLTVLLA